MDPVIATSIFIVGVAAVVLRPDLQAKENAETERLIQEQYQRQLWNQRKQELALKKQRKAFKMPPKLGSLVEEK